jgi:hypothetical protein
MLELHWRAEASAVPAKDWKEGFQRLCFYRHDQVPSLSTLRFQISVQALFLLDRRARGYTAAPQAVQALEEALQPC